MFSPQLRTRVYLSQNENVFTVQIESTEELNYKNMTIVMDYDVPEDVG